MQSGNNRRTWIQRRKQYEYDGWNHGETFSLAWSECSSVLHQLWCLHTLWDNLNDAMCNVFFIARQKLRLFSSTSDLRFSFICAGLWYSRKVFDNKIVKTLYWAFNLNISLTEVKAEVNQTRSVKLQKKFIWETVRTLVWGWSSEQVTTAKGGGATITSEPIKALKERFCCCFCVSADVSQP